MNQHKSILSIFLIFHPLIHFPSVVSLTLLIFFRFAASTLVTCGIGQKYCRAKMSCIRKEMFSQLCPEEYKPYMNFKNKNPEFVRFLQTTSGCGPKEFQCPGGECVTQPEKCPTVEICPDCTPIISMLILTEI